MDEGIEVQQVMDAIEDIYYDESVLRGERKDRLVSIKDEIDILLARSSQVWPWRARPRNLQTKSVCDCIDRDEKREEEVS